MLLDIGSKLRHLNQPVAISIFRRASEKLRVALRDAAEPGWREQLATSSGRSPQRLKFVKF